MPDETPSGGRQRPVLGDLSLVIPTLGREILRESLAKIAAGTAWPAKILIVDQSASAEVSCWLNELRALGIDAQHVPSHERGRANGLNRGIELVRSRFLAITDDDCFADADWLATLAHSLRERPNAVLTGRVEAVGSESVPLTVTNRESSVQSRPSLKFDRLSGGNMAAAHEVFDRVGLFDEDPSIRCAEDAEWAYRALGSGIEIRYVPEAVVSHVGWRSSDELEGQFRAYARSHGGFYGKYLRRGDAFIAARALLHHMRALSRWVRGVARRDAQLAMIGRVYFTGLLPGILAGLRVRRCKDGPSQLPGTG